jgi:hypothetical protein
MPLNRFSAADEVGRDELLERLRIAVVPRPIYEGLYVSDVRVR